MVLKMLLSLLAVALFMIIFFKMVKKNNTQYLYLLIVEFIGIALGFLELVLAKKFVFLLRFIIYLFAIIIPLIVILIEKNKNIEFPEMLNIMLAEIMLKIGKTEEAKKYLYALINKYPNTLIGHELLAKTYEKEGNNSNAISEYLKMSEINPKDYKINLKIASLLYKEKKNDEAIEILQDILSVEPGSIEATLLLGDILFEKEQYKEAVSVYSNALRYNPENYDLYYSLGMAFTMVNDFQKAKEYYEKAAQINSLMYHSKFYLAQIALIYGELDEAELYLFETSKDSELEAGSYFYLGKIAMIKGERDKAINYIKIALDIEPELYKNIMEDQLFIAIRRDIIKPAEQEKVDDKENKKEHIIDKVQEHLAKMYLIVGKLNNSDLTMMRNIKEYQRRDFEKEREE